MQWTLDESRQFQTSDSGYLIRKSVMVRGSEIKIECPVYRAFNHTGGFLGASGEKEDAEQLCIQHHKSKAMT